MNTPITDAAANTITIDCDDSCVSIYVYESDKIYEGGLVPAFVARRLEADRSALMEACQLLLAVAPAKAPAAGLIVGIEAKHKIAIDTGKAVLAAARANFPES